MALVAVPDAIASAILAGVNPTFGFNALIVGTPIGSLFTSSQFMNIGSTAAMMLAVAGVLSGFSGENIVTAMVTLTVLIGLFQLLLGVFKLGRVRTLHLQRSHDRLFHRGSHRLDLRSAW